MKWNQRIINLIHFCSILFYSSPSHVCSSSTPSFTQDKDVKQPDTSDNSHAGTNSKSNVPINEDKHMKKDHQSPYENGVLSLSYTSFLEDINRDAALDDSSGGGTHTMYLIAVYESDCQCSSDLIQKIEKSSKLLQKHFAELGDEYRSLRFVSMPVVGKVDVKGAIKNDELQLLFDIDDAPQLRLVMVRHEYLERDDTVKNGDDEQDAHAGPEIYGLECIGKDSTAGEIFDSILHYWYRLMVAEHMELAAIQTIISDDRNQVAGDDFVECIPSRPIFTMTTIEEMTSFLNLHASLMLKSSRQDIWGVSQREQDFVRNLMEDIMEEDSLHIFVQCRSYADLSTHSLPNHVKTSYDQFEELSLMYVYRKDIAFFTIISDTCKWMDDGEREATEGHYATNGIVRLLSINPSNYEVKWVPGVLFNPSQKKWFQPASTSDIQQFNMTDFALVHATPSLLWLDRYTTASIAFPTYREIHLVLFIDAHSPRRKDGSFDYGSKSYMESKRAISMLHATAQQHKEKSPAVDVVFIIVPSTDVQTLSTFGVNIWSEIDRDCSSSQHVSEETECIVDPIQSLPAAMITSRSESSNYMKVYHLSSDELGTVSATKVNPLTEFLDTYFDAPDSLQPTIRSESLSSNGRPINSTLSSGIKLATAKTFQSMVLSSQKHSIVYFYAPTCGHCKRFDTTWHKLSRLVTEMNWAGQLDVIKIDISRNDIFVDINIESIPAVHFFHKDMKDRPQELMLLDDLLSKMGNGENVKDRKERVDNNLGRLSDATTIMKWVLEMLGSEELISWRHLAKR